MDSKNVGGLGRGYAQRSIAVSLYETVFYCIVLYVPLSLHQSIACLSPESSGLDIGVSEPPTKLVDACWLNTGRLNSAAKSRDCANRLIRCVPMWQDMR